MINITSKPLKSNKSKINVSRHSSKVHRTLLYHHFEQKFSYLPESIINQKGSKTNSKRMNYLKRENKA